MKKIKKSKMFKNTIIITLYLITTEIFFRYISGIKVFELSLIRMALGCLFTSIVFSFLISWFNDKIKRTFNIILAFSFSIYSFLQLGFNNFLGVYISVNTSSQLNAVTDYIREFLASFLMKFYLIFIPFILFLIYQIFIDRFLCKNNNGKKFILKKNSQYEYQVRFLMTLISLIMCAIVYYQTLTVDFMQNSLQPISNKDLFQYPSVPSIVVNEFGVLGFCFLDLKSLYVEEKNTIILEDKEKEPIITKREFNDDLWLEVIASESNQDLQTINSYLINNDITDYNDYTGLFKDKNLIVIMMESVNDIIINEKYYPNFYKMYSEGWAFTNSYSPRNSCATGNNEFSGMTGLYTIYNNCTANVYQKNTYQTSIFNLFKNAGYRAFSMHNYTDAYYDRTVIHPNLGSEKYYSVDDLGIKYFNEYRNWSSDEDFLQVAMDITLNESEEPFMLWLTTVSSHQPYVVSSVEGDKYLELFSDLEYPDDLKRYMSKLKTLDNALGIMLNRLEQKGILEDTVIVLYGDHYPYGLANETINYVLNYNLDDYEVERTPFVIYNPLMEKKEFTQYNTYINITPTVANLFDLDYDPRLYMGSDLFSENYKSRVVFPDGSWKNEIAYYNGATGEIKYNLGYSVDEIKRINNEVMLKIKISNLIIENNYFGLLEQKLALAKESSIASLEGEK